MTNKVKEEKEVFRYTPDNPQTPPSPLLAEYMQKNNIDKAMPLEDARAWFDELRQALTNPKGVKEGYARKAG